MSPILPVIEFCLQFVFPTDSSRVQILGHNVIQKTKPGHQTIHEDKFQVIHAMWPIDKASVDFAFLVGFVVNSALIGCPNI